VLTVNKMDRCFLELKLDGEEAYTTYLRVIENANVILATYQDEAMGDLQVRLGLCQRSGGRIVLLMLGLEDYVTYVSDESSAVGAAGGS
jgi:translation elongation factor EF-G